jgi:hypothetical protein
VNDRAEAVAAAVEGGAVEPGGVTHAVAAQVDPFESKGLKPGYSNL